MIYTIPAFLEELEKKVEGTETRKRGQAKKKLAQIFGASLGLIYRSADVQEPIPYMIFCDPKTGTAYLLKTTHTADFSL